MDDVEKPILSEGTKDQDFQEFKLWLQGRTCALMGVPPESLGFAGDQYAEVSFGVSAHGELLWAVGSLIYKRTGEEAH